jgi:transitional endoplasmic reticulum ATPase
VDWASLGDHTSGYSAAELEAVVLAAANFASAEERNEVTAADVERALLDVVPSRDTRMLDYMELLAVFESSSRSMLPARFATMTTEEVQDRLDEQRLRMGGRVG